MYILEIDSVNKSFGRNMILSDIYLKCKTGDIVGILGRNGSGKSTLLRILFGTLSAEQKFIRIDDKILDRPYTTAGEICYLPQDSHLLQDITLGKVVKLCLQNKEVDLFFDDPLLKNLKASPVSHLSGGESRYAEIKLLLYSDAKFILLDEPFNGLSPVLVESVKDMIRQHAQQKGIILTDHDYRNVLDVANRHYLLSDGGLKAIRGKDDLVLWGYISSSASASLDFDI